VEALYKSSELMNESVKLNKQMNIFTHISIRKFNEYVYVHVCMLVLYVHVKKAAFPQYVMLYGYLYSASHRRLFRDALSVTGRSFSIIELLS